MDFKLISMKKAILFSVFTLLILLAKAQGNLQFNQVKNFSGYITNPNSTSIIPLDTVPSGKVWKIESIGMSPLVESINSAACDKTVFVINGVEYYNHAVRTSANYNLVVLNENLWLKSGDVIGYKGRSVTNCSGNTPQPYFISLIEYNIIP